MYLTYKQLRMAAEAGADSYEMSCSWKSAREAIVDYVKDELAFVPNDAQIATAVQMAKTIWGARVLAAKRAIEGAA